MRFTFLLLMFYALATTINAQETGCVEGDCTNGEGTYIYKSGSKYKGNWKEGKKHGYGLLNYASGEKYEGNFKNDQMHGVGTYHYSDGSVYNGEWENNRKNGMGKFTFSDGSMYIGTFDNDKMKGFGTYFYDETTSETGIWDGTEPIEIFASNGVFISLQWALEYADTVTSLKIREYKLENEKELFGEMHKLKKLKSLSFTGCGLEQLPVGIKELQNLEYLNCAGNLILLEEAPVYSLKKLKTLNLEQNELKSIPPKIAQLVNLEELLLAANRIEKLPDEIFELKNLKMIDLRDNPISKEEIAKIKKKFKEQGVDVLF